MLSCVSRNGLVLGNYEAQKNPSEIESELECSPLPRNEANKTGSG